MGRSPFRPLRFTRLRLVNWRNFRSVDVPLATRAFFIGPNASGKSNFLDAIRFLSEVAKSGKGGLQGAVQARGGFSALRCLHARNPPYVELDADVGDDAEHQLWRYRLRINKIKREHSATVIEEDVWRQGALITERKRPSTGDEFEYSQTLVEQAQGSRNFRELVEFFASCRYLHVVPQIVRDRARARAGGEDPYGGDLLRRMKEMPKKTREPRMRRLASALRLAVPQFSDIALEDDADGVPHLLASYKHWRPDASKQSEVVFSDGTLRMIGLLWSIAERGGPLLLEEPELSLNDSVVSELPRLFARMQKLSGRQIIATTHSSAFLDDTGIGLKEVHRILVDDNGSTVETLSDNPSIVAQTAEGMTIGQAVLPLLRPQNLENLGDFVVAA